MQNKYLIVLFVGIIGCVQAQENARRRIAPILEKCYRNPELLQRDNRLPMTIQTLIELIRKIEDQPNFDGDMRNVAVGMTHRYRQDGIEWHPDVQLLPGVLPFSPRGPQFAKHSILLTTLIPNQSNFPNDTLTSVERCSLHFMLSSTIELNVRGDEAQRCSQLAQYRSERVPRSDVRFGRMEMEENGEQVEEEPVGEPEEYEDAAVPEEESEVAPPVNMDELGAEDIDPRQSNPNVNSACPVESGVLRTLWGTVNGGALIAGIAAGLQYQQVTVREVVIATGNEMNARQTANIMLDNRFAATLAGDLAEVAIQQGPFKGANEVGVSGAWNSTAIPRWFFLSRNVRLDMTDSEIRGGLDGLILGLNIMRWREQVPQLRLSQVLDMYYSDRGVFSREIRACNRNTLFTSVAPVETLRSQTAAFAIVLDRQSGSPATLDQENTIRFANEAVELLSAYIPSRMSDISCQLQAFQTVQSDNLFRSIATEVFIFVDTQWTFLEVQPVVASLLESLQISSFHSRYNLLSSFDGSTIVNSTYSVSEFFAAWNTNNHQQLQGGLSMPNVLRSLRERTTVLMEGERTNNTVGGRSKVALVIVNTAAPNSGDVTFAVQQIQIIREEVPDLRLLFLAGGAPERFNQFVQNPQRDIFRMQPATGTNQNIAQTVTPIVQRIQAVPRRIINPRCGANFQASGRGANSMVQHVEPNGIVYYRLHPNYFFLQSTDGPRTVRIQGMGFGSLMVCSSRTVELPQQNNTQGGDVTCRSVLSDSFEVDLTNACSDHREIHNCPPLFISVEGRVQESNQNFRCLDVLLCQFPDNLRYVVHTNNLDCFSGVSRMLGTMLSIILPVVMALRRFF